MNSKIKVSICCLSYNHGEYIEKALSSMLNQKTDFEYEIIVLDDCSTDNTREIINNFQRKYPNKIRKIFQKTNQYQKGISVVNKFFYPIARGKYISYCEGDDYWINENKLQLQVDFLDNNPKYVAHTHECKEIDEYGKVITNYYFNGCHKTVYDLKIHTSLQILSGQTATIMHRKESFVVRDNSLFEFGQLNITGDVKKTAFLAMNGPIYHENIIMSHHRRVYKTGDSWSAKTTNRNLRIFYFNALDELSEYLSNYFGKEITYEKFKLKMLATSFYLFVLRKESFGTFKYMYSSMKGIDHFYLKFFLMILHLPLMRIQIKYSRKKNREEIVL